MDLTSPGPLISGRAKNAWTLEARELLRLALPLAQHEELPGLGHMGPITHSQRFNERVRQFLQPHSRFASTSVLPGRAVSLH